MIRRPGFAALAICALALGIGAATAVFSVVDAVLLRPLPYRDPDRLVAIWDKLPRENRATIFASYADFAEFSRNSRTLENVAAATWAVGSARVLTGQGPARQVMAIPSSASFFETLGVAAAMGRTFTPSDEGHGCAVVLSHSFWSAKLGADPAVLNRALTLDQESCAVLGVMPENFVFYPAGADMWVLLGPEFRPQREGIFVGIFARLKPGVTLARAQAEIEALHRALHSGDREKELEPEARGLHGEFTFLASRTLRTTLIVVFTAVLLLLLIACLNVSNLLLSRLPERQRELAIRAALGSGQGRLVRQMMSEALVLSLAGAGLGVLLAEAGLRAFRAISPIELTAGARPGMNLPVLLFGAGLAAGVALLSSLLPALRVSKIDIVERLKGTGPSAALGRFGAAKIMIAAQMAVTFVLLMGADLLIGSALRMGSENLGFDPRHIMTTHLVLPPARYPESAQRARFEDELLRRLKAMPGVSGAAMATRLPPYLGGGQRIEVRGRSEPTVRDIADTSAETVSPRYFETLGTPLLRGRDFGDRDRLDSEPVAIVNRALALRYFADEDPIGRQVKLEGSQWMTIVGVTANAKHTELLDEMKWAETPVLYRPLAQDPRPALQIAVRASRDARAIGDEIQKQISSLDPEVPANDAEPLEASLTRTLAYPRFRAGVLSWFALAALALSAIGLHGVLTQLVARRMPEFGVRRAVGAQTSDLLSLVARQAGAPVAAGIACGIAGTLAFGRLLEKLLYGVGSSDPGAMFLAAAGLGAIAVVAIAAPAIRAARVDPMTALRSE